MNTNQIRAILLGTFVPAHIGIGSYDSDLAYKLCNHDISLSDLIKYNYDDIVIESFAQAESMQLGWEDFPELS